MPKHYFMGRIHFIGIMCLLLVPACQPTKPAARILPMPMGDKYGYTDGEGNILIPPLFDEAGLFWDSLALVRTGDTIMYINKTGEARIMAVLKKAKPFDNGEAEVWVGEDFATLDTNGVLRLSHPHKLGVKNLNHSRLFAYGEEGERTAWDDMKYGLVDLMTDGVVSPARFTWIGQFHEGLAAFELDGKFGYFDTTGKTAIKPIFDMAYDFSKGRAWVRQNGLWGLINKQGRMLIRPRFDEVPYYFKWIMRVRKGGDVFYINSEGERLRHIDSMVLYHNGLVYMNGKFGYHDSDGKRIVVTPEFEDAESFQNGFGRVMMGGKWAFIDTRGRLVTPFKYDELKDFKNGFAGFRVGGAWGMMDTLGKEIIPPLFEDLGGFQEGAVPAKSKGYWGYVDERGETLLDFQYLEASDFTNEAAVVKMGDGHNTVVDKEGGIVFPPTMSGHGVRISGFSEGWASFSLQLGDASSCGFVNGKGQVMEIKWEPDSL